MQIPKLNKVKSCQIVMYTKPLLLKASSSSIEEGILETKTDYSGKDRLFFACVAFWVMTFDCSAPQNDRLKFSFVKDIRVVVKKMVRNGRKTAIRAGRWGGGYQ